MMQDQINATAGFAANGRPRRQRIPDKVVSAEAAAALIPDCAIISVSASSGVNCPDRVLQAIGDRFDREGHPRGLTTLHPIAAGDMYGIKGVDHLAKPGLLTTIVGGSYPSGPSSLPMPAIWRMIMDNQVAAYNVPSGVLFDMHRDAAAKRAGVLTKVGIDTFVDPRRQGCKMNDAATARGEIVRVVDFADEEWLHFPNIHPTVAIIRGTTADELGNISMEHEAALLGVLEQALAARNSGGIVIAQVKRLTAARTISTQRVHVPSMLVDYVVVDPAQQQATQTPYDPAISGEIRRPLEDFAPVPWSVDKVIARRAAMELSAGDVVNLGFGISALVPKVLIDGGRPYHVTWAIEQGPVGGVPVTDFLFGSSVNAEAILPAPQQFTYLQGGGFDCTLLSFLEIDGSGNVNVSQLKARPYLTAGAGGFVDITARARKIVFGGYFTAGGRLDAADGCLRIREDGKIQKLVPAVEHVTFSGQQAIKKGQDVIYVTERCVLRMTAEGPTVIEIAPGIDLARDVLGRAGFPLAVDANLRTMDARLFSPAPMSFDVAGAERPHN
jgi:acyl CoA:acetate/3-ketoacid CoA transferase